MHESLHVVWELALIVASVLIFRSTWLLLDNYFGNRALWLLLALGIVLSIPALYVLNSHLKEKYQRKAH